MTRARAKLLSLSLLLLSPGMAWSLDVTQALKWRVGAVMLDEPGSLERGDRSSTEVYTDLYAGLLVHLNPQLHFNARLQGFLSSEELFLNTEDTPQPAESYAAAREFWLGYTGISGLPGNVLRFGRQRIKAYDGLWWDRDISALHWHFDTTLVQARLALAERLFATRTDRQEVDARLRDRTFLLAGLRLQHRPGHFVGVRATHAVDHGSLGAGPTDDPKSSLLDVSWLGVQSHNDYFDYRANQVVAYRVELIGASGEREQLGPAPVTRDVQAWALDTNLRFQPLANGPLRFGLAFAKGSGGADASEYRQFEQTGLHSNRSRFTGTRAMLERFNWALQPELSNLRVSSAFMALQFDTVDSSLIYHRFTREDRTQPIQTRGFSASPVNDNPEIGEGFDLVVSWYFERMARMPIWDDDTHANVRLRASRFDPGDAYGDMGALLRAALEFTLYL